MSTSTARTTGKAMPLVGVTSCTFVDGITTSFKVGDKYMRAILESSDAMPMGLPTFGSSLDMDTIFDHVDGLLFTGSLSNVHPEHYGTAPSKQAEPYDQDRDDTTLPLLKEAIKRGVPTLCICRGFQELNVAMGGTLFPLIHEVEGRQDHRRPDGDTDTQYGPNHSIKVHEGGMLEAMLADTDERMVNSLHLQGVRDLGPGLRVEGTAEDGTVEAVSLKNPNGFLFAVQWHPEYKSTENPISRAIFKAFGEALRSA